MKKVKKTSKENSKFFDSKEKKIGAVITGVLLLIVTAVIMFLESGEGKISVKNDTDLKLEYINAYFVNAEGPMYEGVQLYDIGAGNSGATNFGEYQLLYQAANLEIHFKFEGYDELFVDSGYFNDNFNGNVKIRFEQTKDQELLMKINAKNGVLSSSLIDCNDVFTINLKEGIVEE